MRRDYIKNNLTGAEAKAFSNKIDGQFYIMITMLLKEQLLQI